MFSCKLHIVESHLRRLTKLNQRGLGIGGVLGAKNRLSELDLVGVPRLDISVHSPERQADIGFIEKLDPALKRVRDPLEPATVAVHFIRHAESFFSPREGGLHCADPLECLFDLYEARLQKQASRFLDALLRQHPGNP